MPRNSPLNKAVAELGRMPNPRYKKKYQPKHRKDGTFKVSKLGKYNSRGINLDGAFFHSEAEANRYLQLKVMEAAGKISRIERQVPYQIAIDGTHVCTYNADFRYFITDPMGGTLAIVIEDVKGQRTHEFILKKKLVEAKHKIRVIELPASWLKHYEGKHALDCIPIIEQLTKDKKARASAKKEARRLALEAARDAKQDMKAG